MTTLSERLDILEMSLNTIENSSSEIPTEDETEAARKEIFSRVEALYTSMKSIELKVSMLEEVINSA